MRYEPHSFEKLRCSDASHFSLQKRGMSTPWGTFAYRKGYI